MSSGKQITHVAIKTSKHTYSLPKPNRHHNVIRMIHDLFIARDYENEPQGFLDEDGNFLNRREAYELAVSTGQINRSKHPPNSYNGNELYSEDLW